MTKKHLETTKLLVSTAISMTVLTLMLTGCKNTNRIDKSTTITNTIEETNSDLSNDSVDTVDKNDYEELKDGEYELYVSLSGGSGKATVTSPTKAYVSKGDITVTIEWSSPNYDYMIVDGNKYLPVNTSGNSVFEIPLEKLESDINVVADTVAMSKPHEVEYELLFSLTDQNEIEADCNNTEKENTINVPDDIKEWISKHTISGKMERKYAEKFGVCYYDNKYCILTINGTDYYLLASDEESVPSDLPDSIAIINVPIDNVYVVSSASYNYFSSLGDLSCITFTSLKNDEIDDERLKDKLNDGTTKYAGKYSAPDYELLLSNGCNLVVENTMILHSMDVLNQFDKLNINTLIDYSSYESTPFGRMEWIKLYGLLTGNEKAANEIFVNKEKDLLNKYENTDKKVAYFYVTNNGGVVIRRNQDYIAKLIDIAGGKYLFSDMSDYSGTGQTTIQKEAFLEAAVDCDYLIYNSTIGGKINSVEELISLCSVIKNTKAYKDGNIYCTDKNMYLKVMELPEIAKDINDALNGREVSKYLYKLTE